MNKEATHIIAVRRQYYAETITNDRGWQILEYGNERPYAGNRTEMRNVVEDYNDRRYMLANGECGRPKYRVTSLESNFGKNLLKSSGFRREHISHCVGMDH